MDQRPDTLAGWLPCRNIWTVYCYQKDFFQRSRDGRSCRLWCLSFSPTSTVSKIKGDILPKKMCFYIYLANYLWVWKLIIKSKFSIQMIQEELVSSSSSLCEILQTSQCSLLSRRPIIIPDDSSVADGTCTLKSPGLFITNVTLIKFTVHLLEDEFYVIN